MKTRKWSAMVVAAPLAAHVFWSTRPPQNRCCSTRTVNQFLFIKPQYPRSHLAVQRHAHHQAAAAAAEREREAEAAAAAAEAVVVVAAAAEEAAAAAAAGDICSRSGSCSGSSSGSRRGGCGGCCDETVSDRVQGAWPSTYCVPLYQPSSQSNHLSNVLQATPRPAQCPSSLCCCGDVHSWLRTTPAVPPSWIHDALSPSSRSHDAAYASISASALLRRRRQQRAGVHAAAEGVRALRGAAFGCDSSSLIRRRKL
jgi:hypothetical protein